MYFLVAGEAVKGYSGRRSSSSDLPLLYVDFPGRMVSQDVQYHLESDVRILHISASMIFEFGADIARKIVDGVKGEVGKQFSYDVFLSYTFDDEARIQIWGDKMRSSGLRVYMRRRSELDLQPFPLEVAAAIADSLVFMAFISEQTMKRGGATNWVRREIELRRAGFDGGVANILPVALPGGRVAEFAGGLGSVDAVTRSDEQAMSDAIGLIEKVRSDLKSGPAAVRRVPAEKLRGIFSGSDG